MSGYNDLNSISQVCARMLTVRCTVYGWVTRNALGLIVRIVHHVQEVGAGRDSCFFWSWMPTSVEAISLQKLESTTTVKATKTSPPSPFTTSPNGTYTTAYYDLDISIAVP